MMTPPFPARERAIQYGESGRFIASGRSGSLQWRISF